MDNNKRITLTQLMQRAAQREDSKKRKVDIYIEPLDGYLSFDRIPLAEMLEKMGMIEEDPTPKESIEFSCDVISSCCSVFRDRALMEAYECDTPGDLVLAVFDENVAAINGTFAKIMEWYGIDDDAVKN